jgi:hypothetical protein
MNTMPYPERYVNARARKDTDDARVGMRRIASRVERVAARADDGDD